MASKIQNFYYLALYRKKTKQNKTGSLVYQPLHALMLFFKIALDIFGISISWTHFKIILSISTENPAGIFVVIALTL